MANIVSLEIIASKIFEIRGRKVMSDKDLAELYGVKTKRLNEQVRRNINRFPDDFMFQLTQEETASSRSQFATLKQGQNIKYMPYAFTQEGVAMLSGVLNSDRAVEVNIRIMRAFVKFKELLLTHKELAIKLEALEKKYTEHDEKIRDIFEAIRQLLAPPKVEGKRIIGFQKT